MIDGCKLYDAATLDALSATAASVPRRRKNLNVHPLLADPVQRLFNALEPGTYARPHRHVREEGWELMLVVRGALSILLFDDSGQVLRRIDLRAGVGDYAVEISAFVWHSVVSLVPGSILFEVKVGPYLFVEDKDFAAWAPSEDEASAGSWVQWFEIAQVGDRFTGGQRLP